jgi:hypothetical protein
MRLVKKSTSFPEPLADDSIVRLLWREDCWQPGDPMFDAIAELQNVPANRDQKTLDLITEKHAGGRAGESEDLSADLAALNDSRRC